MIVVLAAAIGMALIYLPNLIISNYAIVQQLGSIWATLYLVVIGLGVLLLLGSAGWTIWKMWGASIAKNRRRARRNLNPSELSSGQRDREIEENIDEVERCLLYTSPSPRDRQKSRMPSSA